jgi:hypothetical protein
MSVIEFASEGFSMSLIRVLTGVGAVVLCARLNAPAQRPQEQAFMTYGRARIALGMTVEQAEQRLAESSRHIQFLSDKETATVYQNGVTDDFEGQITFGGGHVIYADYHLPNARTADELAQEIAGAVDSMETKTCTISNFAAHGTGGGHSDTIFECGARRFVVFTMQTLGSNARTINVDLEIGQTVAK